MSQCGWYAAESRHGNLSLCLEHEYDYLNYCVVLPPDVVVKEDHLLDAGELGAQHRPDLGLVLQPRGLVHPGPQLRPRLALRNLDTVLRQAQPQLLLHRVRQGHLDMEISIFPVSYLNKGFTLQLQTLVLDN